MMQTQTVETLNLHFLRGAGVKSPYSAFCDLNTSLDLLKFWEKENKFMHQEKNSAMTASHLSFCSLVSDNGESPRAVGDLCLS